MPPYPTPRWDCILSYRLLAALLVLSGLALASCNLRENSLLPPNLDPKQYVMENTIRVYSDHLIKSENDRSYLYIPKESIADSALWYGDVVTLQQVEDLTARDSLAFPAAAEVFSKTYLIRILRFGSEILLDSLPSFATLYTGLEAEGSLANVKLVQSAWRLSAESATIYPYGAGRCWFALDGNGDHALLDFHDSVDLQLNPVQKDLQALIVTDTDYIYLWFPGEYRTTEASLQVQDSLTEAEAAVVQKLLPGFALNTKVLSVQTAYAGEATPIVRYRRAQARGFSQQWTRLDGPAISGWQEGEDTWLWEDGELISFLQGAGKYFLCTPLQGQNELTLPLDGSLSQVFLQDIWLDLHNLKLPNTSLRLLLEPDLQATVANYFSGTPFTLTQTDAAFELRFVQGNSVLESLPGNAWIEYGFRSDLQNPANARLFRVFRTAALDNISYKTLAASYDATHFSQANGYIYSGINSSGQYLLGIAAETSSSLALPCLKPELRIQTSRTYLSWQDSSLPCSSLLLEYAATVAEAHPWLSGKPYTLQNSQSILKISASARGRNVDEIPANLFLSTTVNSAPSSIINFSSAANYPKFYRYKAANAFEHNSYVLSGGKLQISPASAGYLIDGANFAPTRQSIDLALFNRMTFDDYAWELYLDSAHNLAAGTVLQITPKKASTDTHGVFAQQYDLASLAPVYDFKILGNAGFYADFQPLIRIKQTARSQNLLFSVSAGEYYRIYSYTQSETLDGWHFRIADGHLWFYLPYDAEYSAVQDLAPHTVSDALVSDLTQDHITSLYQAQITLPREFLGSALPLGSHVSLGVNTDLPQSLNALSAYDVQFRNPQLQIINPNFFNDVYASRWPYVYIPIPDYSPGQTIRLFRRNLAGQTQELNLVQSFSAIPTNEFILVGNCAVGFINNSATFYTTD